jgi:hypothetical protein
MAHGDAAVKARLCQREVLRALMEAAAARHVRPELQVRLQYMQRYVLIDV